MSIENHFLQLILLLLIILPASKLAGYLSVRLGQPSVLGELLIGVLLGPTLLDLLHVPVFGSNSSLPEFIKELGEIGVLLLMFVAGIELHLDEMRKTSKVASLAGTLGVLVPVGLGWLVGVLFGLETQSAMFLGLTLGATSVSISAQTLMELKVLRSRVGLGLLGAAVFDDILVIFLLSVFFGLTGGAGDYSTIALVLGRMFLYLSLAVLVGIWILPPLLRWVRSLPVSQNVLALAIIVMLAYALTAELIGGMAAITGAFLAGLMFARLPERELIEQRIGALAYGFFVPIFFVDIGLETDLSNVGGVIWLALTLVVVAILGKLLGAGTGAWLAGYTPLESMQLGAGMVSRGEVGLIVASVGAGAGLISQANLSAVVSMVVISTLVTPPLLRYLFQYKKNKPVEKENL
jgi:Kef-type K+ transport system membrane component KefB